MTGKVTKRLLRLKLAQGFGRWAQVSKDLRAAELRKNECAKRVVEVLFRYRGRQELRCAFFTWRRALPPRKARPRRRRAKPARQARVGQCSCVYGTSAGFSCTCSKKSHTERRLDMLRRKVDGMLADGHANLPKPPRSERAKRVHLAGSGRFHAFLDVAATPAVLHALREKRGAAATETLRRSVDAARRRVPGADARLLDGPPTVERLRASRGRTGRGGRHRRWW